VIAVLAYVVGVNGFYIPHIGDEAPYIEIVRLTAESGHWLPLRTAAGLENTKPPGLFWLGIATTNWAKHWSFTVLRVPIVGVTLLVAVVVYWTARRLRWSRNTAALAGLTYLGFYSSFQYGRPFLTNAPETLFVFLSFALVLLRERVGRWAWVAAGLSLGVGCFFKSFAIVAPVGVAVCWMLLAEHRFRLRAFIEKEVWHLVALAVIALGVFALWPLLDPNPGAILKSFVIEENLGKLGGEGYLRGLVAGPYALHRIWAGHFFNAGLFALPLAYAAAKDFRDRRHLGADRKALWILVLSFMVVYSLPSQRQGNYLLPSVPALALLIASRWDGISERWLRVFALTGLAASGVLLWLMLAVAERELPPGSYRGWHYAVPALAFVLWAGLIARPRHARRTYHALVFLTFLAVASALAPFEGALGRFEPERVEALSGRRVYVPTEFISKHERHRFLLPGVDVRGYDANDAAERARLLEAGSFVILHRPVSAESAGPFRVFATRLDLRSRQTVEEMLRILIRRETDLLVRRELVVRLRRLERRLEESRR
jgi:4-amino-4-deoxy-L-arabinose transferase-like glycosyltransferase